MNNNFENIFNLDFFPTPVEVIEQMIGMTEIRNKKILDPSAGTGNILNWCKERGAETFASEINMKWNQILSKNHEVIGTDFFGIKKEDVSHIDMIVMNPPFSECERHILHAWDILPDGGELISLCNTSMLNNNYYSSRKEILEIIDDYGTREDIGQAFSKSNERKTDVEISIIHLYKPKSDNDDFTDYFISEDDELEKSDEQGIITHNVVRECVNRYVNAVKMFDDVNEASKKINSLTTPFGGSEIIFGAFKQSENYHTEITKKMFCKNLQKNAWNWIFKQFNMEAYITTNVMSEMNKFVETHINMPFTMKNIYNMIQMIIGSHKHQMDKCIEDIFDYICEKSSDNCTAKETWRTNKVNMLNKKIILPYMCEQGLYSFNKDKFTISSRNYQNLDDIVKVLCYLNGVKYENNMSCWELNKRELYFNEWHDWGFFKLKGFKKGTIHLIFKDDEVWARFNQALSRIRGFVIPKTNRK